MPGLIELHRRVNALGAEWRHVELRVSMTPTVTLGCRSSGGGIRQGIHPLPKNDLGSNDSRACADQELATRQRLPMMLVSLAGKRNPKGDISQAAGRPACPSFFGTPWRQWS